MLYQVCEHNDGSAFLFPHHTPEIIHSFLQGTLCSNVLIGEIILRGNRGTVKEQREVEENMGEGEE